MIVHVIVGGARGGLGLVDDGFLSPRQLFFGERIQESLRATTAFSPIWPAVARSNSSASAITTLRSAASFSRDTSVLLLMIFASLD